MHIPSFKFSLRLYNWIHRYITSSLYNLIKWCYLITVITTDSPGSVLVDTNTLTSSSVAISWTAVCNTIFTYNVNSTINGTTTSNSTVLEGLVTSDDNYCVTVTATDYTNRTSDQSCFRFNG